MFSIVFKKSPCCKFTFSKQFMHLLLKKFSESILILVVLYFLGKRTGRGQHSWKELHLKNSLGSYSEAIFHLTEVFLRTGTRLIDQLWTEFHLAASSTYILFWYSNGAVSKAIFMWVADVTVYPDALELKTLIKPCVRHVNHTATIYCMVCCRTLWWHKMTDKASPSVQVYCIEGHYKCITMSYSNLLTLHFFHWE